MEELQDAIEDAQYMNAMHDDLPKPTKEWKFPTQEERDAYCSSVLAKNPNAFEAEAICTGSLGLYLVSIHSLILEFFSNFLSFSS